MSYIETYHHECPKCGKVYKLREDLIWHLTIFFWHKLKVDDNRG